LLSCLVSRVNFDIFLEYYYDGECSVIVALPLHPSSRGLFIVTYCIAVFYMFCFSVGTLTCSRYLVTSLNRLHVSCLHFLMCACLVQFIAKKMLTCCISH
jgi:hypothetical protein